MRLRFGIRARRPLLQKPEDLLVGTSPSATAGAVAPPTTQTRCRPATGYCKSLEVFLRRIRLTSRTQSPFLHAGIPIN